MKRILGLAALILGVFVFVEGCSSSQSQQTEDGSLKEKETFTFDEIKSDSSAPIPVDSVSIASDVDDAQKTDIPSVKTRKKSMDSQESPVTIIMNNKSNKIDTVSKKIIPEKAEYPEETHSGQYIVQLGAFQSIANAKEFIKKNTPKIKRDLNIHFNERGKLYQVQLQPVDSKTKAQGIVKELRKKGYNDVFVILPVE